MRSKSPGLGELLARGAEAHLYLVRWFGREAVLKLRQAKRYRVPSIDNYIRRRRTYAEAKAMLMASDLGVPTPALYYINIDEGAIVMEYIRGSRLRELLFVEEGKEYLVKFGEYIGIMHSNGLLHGDLSPANVVVRDGDLVLIDFGLAELAKPTPSKRYVEKLAVDLNVLFRSLESTYGRKGERLKGYVVEGYRKALENLADYVVDTVYSIRRRARYVERRTSF